MPRRVHTVATTRRALIVLGVMLATGAALMAFAVIAAVVIGIAGTRLAPASKVTTTPAGAVSGVSGEPVGKK